MNEPVPWTSRFINYRFFGQVKKNFVSNWQFGQVTGKNFVKNQPWLHRYVGGAAAILSRCPSDTAMIPSWCRGDTQAGFLSMRAKLQSFGRASQRGDGKGAVHAPACAFWPRLAPLARRPPCAPRASSLVSPRSIWTPLLIFGHVCARLSGRVLFRYLWGDFFGNLWRIEPERVVLSCGFGNCGVIAAFFEVMRLLTYCGSFLELEFLIWCGLGFGFCVCGRKRLCRSRLCGG